jgi:hypothetical protein
MYSIYDIVQVGQYLDKWTFIFENCSVFGIIWYNINSIPLN